MDRTSSRCPKQNIQPKLTSRFVRLDRLPWPERLEAVDDRGCTPPLPVPGELGRTLGGGPGSAPGERRCK